MLLWPSPTDESSFVVPELWSLSLYNNSIQGQYKNINYYLTPKQILAISLEDCAARDAAARDAASLTMYFLFHSPCIFRSIRKVLLHAE